MYYTVFELTFFMDKEKLLLRLKRIKGQIEGLQRMIEAERKCEDILIQVKATNKALQKVGEQILKCNLDTCIDKKISKKDMKSEIESMLKSLMDL